MTYEIKPRQTATEKTDGIESWHRVLTGKASVRRRAGSWKREFNRDVKRQKILIEMLPLVRRLALKIREHLPAHVEVDGRADRRGFARRDTHRVYGGEQQRRYRGGID